MTQLHAVYKKPIKNIMIKGGQTLKGWKKIYHENINQNKAGIAILIPEKTDFRGRKIKKKIEKCYI